MHRRIRAASAISLVAAGVAGLVLVGGSAATSTLPAADGGTTPPPPKPFVDRQQFGVLELVTDPGGILKVNLDFADAGTTDIALDLSPTRRDRCRVDVDRMDQALKLQVARFTTDGTVVSVDSQAPLSRAIALVDNGLGSRDQDNCNRSNGRLEPGQGFIIELGNDSRLKNVVFDYGVMDIEAKFGADLYATTTLLNGSKTVFEDPLGNASDNDADAAGADNNRIQIIDQVADVAAADETLPTFGTLGARNDDFNQLALLPINKRVEDDPYIFDRGQLSLEGGGDFADGTNRTTFNLVKYETFDYTVVCVGDSDPFGTNPDATVTNPQGQVIAIVETPTDNDWFPVGGDADPAKARVFRYFGYQHTNGVYKDSNNDGYPDPKTDCLPIGLEVSASSPGVLIDPSDETAFLRLELTWHVPAAEVNSTSDPAFNRTIDLDGPGGANAVAAPYCEGFGPSRATSNPASTFQPTDPGVADHLLIDLTDPTKKQFVPWCVLSDVRELQVIGDTEYIVQTQIWDGIGDPYFR